MKFNQEKLEIFYIENYKKIMLIPIITFVIALILLGVKVAQTGDFINKDVSLRGGITGTINIKEDVDIVALEKAILVKSNIRKLTDPTTGTNVGVMIEVSDIKLEDLQKILEKQLNIKLTKENFSVEETGPALGDTFYKGLVKALLISFLLMGLAVIISFRKLIPSFGVIFTALADITITLVIVNISGMELSVAGIVAFLFLTGYSVDTDIILTTKVLKSTGGSVFSRMVDAAKTGLTMTATTMAVMIVGITFSTSPVFKEMFTVLLIGLFVDIYTTYLTNTGILFWYATGKRK